MSNSDEETDQVLDEETEYDTAEDFYIDILTGNKEKPSPKKLLIQKVLRQLIDSYGFDRADLEVDYKPRIKGYGKKKIDIAIFLPREEHINENVQRMVICKQEAMREKLRSIADAESDLQGLKELMELLPECSLGMWTNGQEEFFLYAEHTRFETQFKPLGVWPVPGEGSSDLERTGGVIQISADSKNLEDALMRCYKYLNRNLGHDHKDAFKQLALLMLAKIYDETRPREERQFWIRGEEPFTPEGQNAIRQRIDACLRDARNWQPELLSPGWILILEPDQTARVVMELARYSLSETKPQYRTEAFRAVARFVMDGRQGRYPTPLNVAEMAVHILDPKKEERILDCACGTGTFPAMAATYIFQEILRSLNTSPEEATLEQLLEAQNRTAQWAASNSLSCDIDPFLVVTSRMNLLFTIGHPGRVFRLDSRTYPVGDLDGVEAGSLAMPLGSVDVVLLNPWFSTQEPVKDESILRHYELGHIWEQDGEGGYRNTGAVNTGGVPPEVIFLEKAIQWVKPSTGRIGILLPDGLLGNPGDEYIRWWILRHCKVLASIDLPLEPFKVIVKEYKLTPALCSLLILRKRSQEELIHTEHTEYKVFMAIVDHAGVDARGSLLFERAPDGEELIFEEEVVERVRVGDEVQVKHTKRRNRRINDELPFVAEKYREFLRTGEVTL